MTTLGASLVITGEVTSDEDLVIAGRVNGPITVRGRLTIAEQARLRGDVRGHSVLVRGQVHGAVSASERIELEAAANVTGSLSANRVVLADGSRFHGAIDMGQRTIAAKVARYKAGQGSAMAR
jgi:cytoskeletal protein CcmA (bactofilin family)